MSPTLTPLFATFLTFERLVKASASAWILLRGRRCLFLYQCLLVGVLWGVEWG